MTKCGAEPEKRHCCKCGVRLIEGENWSLSSVKTHNYICLNCRRVYNREYYLAHRAEIIARTRAWVKAQAKGRW